MRDNIKFCLGVAFACLFASFAILYAFAESNYDSARAKACLSEGTDAAIFEIMAKHGFYDDDFLHEPTWYQKIEALAHRQK